jgi:muconolactone delta-isomerase
MHGKWKVMKDDSHAIFLFGQNLAHDVGKFTALWAFKIGEFHNRHWRCIRAFAGASVRHKTSHQLLGSLPFFFDWINCRIEQLARQKLAVQRKKQI